MEPKSTRRRFKKILIWGTLLFVATLVGGGVFAYSYATDSTTLANKIREQAPKYLPDCRVDVQRVRVRPFVGEVSINYALIQQVEKDGHTYPVGQFPWVHLSFDPWAMLDGRFEPRLIVVAQPTIRLRRRSDGTWNFQDLLADPWPKAKSKRIPPIRVENGKLELIDDSVANAKPVAVLRDVSLEITPGPTEGSIVTFEGSARGHLFEHVHLKGTFDCSTGVTTLQGDVAHLSIPELLRAPLPAEVRPTLDAVRLTGGEVDLTIRSLVYDPNASPKLHHECAVRLRAGVLSPKELPYSINDLSASVTILDDRATIERAEGFNGPTTLRVNGSASVHGPDRGGFDLTVDVIGLELDDRLRQWTPTKFQGLWKDFRPAGRVDMSWRGARKDQNATIDWGLGVGLRDVSMEYHLFRYPLEHVTGVLTCKPKWVEFDLATSIGGKTATAKGRVDDPGPNPLIKIDFTAGALPVDKSLKAAMPPDVRAVVETFSPAGTVHGSATLTRRKLEPGENLKEGSKKAVRFDAAIDLNPDCEMTWDGLKYKVSNMTGHLEVHPDLWIFRNVRGAHGQAKIKSDGQVSRVAGGGFDVALKIDADNLQFDQQLRDALPIAWRTSWDTLNPTGASDVEATITVKPGLRDRYQLVIHPRTETNLRLAFDRAPEAGEADTPAEARRLEMRMEDITGTFIFDNGKVQLIDGGFLFRNSPVTFAKGEVQVFDSGQFTLNVQDLYVKDFRFDAGLRKMMPPMMAQFTRRLDDGKTFTTRTDLGLAWSGKPGEPPSCSWEKGLVVLNGNSIQAGVPIRSIQGQIDHLHGWFNGRDLNVQGVMQLASVNLFDQQVTNVSSPIDVSDNKARLTNIQGTLLEGAIEGNLEISLDSTPRFETNLKVVAAQLESYAKTLRGRQSFKGLISAELHLNGLGSDPHTLQGKGEAHVMQGDLGRLPAIFGLFKVLQLAPNTRTAFDSADVNFNIRNGETDFNPILFTGNAFSLQGHGTLDPQENLDIKLRVLYGRDNWHLPLVSDAVREASAQFFVVRVVGTASSPSFKMVPFPQASKFVKSLGARREDKMEERRK